jgi:hypothetical protein
MIPMPYPTHRPRGAIVHDSPDGQQQQHHPAAAETIDSMPQANAERSGFPAFVCARVQAIKVSVIAIGRMFLNNCFRHEARSSLPLAAALAPIAL